MYSTQFDTFAIAQKNLYSYLEQQSSVLAPRLKPLVPKSILVERVGFTRNASNTPYIVYLVNNRRCCTFIKRRWFVELVQILLKLVKGIEAKIRSCTSTQWSGLNVKTDVTIESIASSYINKFFEEYNAAAISWAEAECNCDILLFGFCRHTITDAIAHLKLQGLHQLGVRLR